MVNFQGFKKVVDTLGGVTIDVQNPVVDDRYPADDGTDLRVYIPAGVQHMTGAQALVYARSRHGSNDFDRASRQQRVILSIRQQANPQTVLANLSPLLDALKSSFKTDIPLTTNVLPELIQLSSQINTANIRSYVFSPPRYGTEGYPGGIYSIEPNVALIRSTVANAFKIDPKLEQLRDAVSAENGTIWVVNGSGKTGQANTLVAYLEYEGLTAIAQTQRPPTLLAKTQIKVYNGRRGRAAGDGRPAREGLRRDRHVRHRSERHGRHHRDHRQGDGDAHATAGTLSPTASDGAARSASTQCLNCGRRPRTASK